MDALTKFHDDNLGENYSISVRPLLWGFEELSFAIVGNEMIAVDMCSHCTCSGSSASAASSSSACKSKSTLAGGAAEADSESTDKAGLAEAMAKADELSDALMSKMQLADADADAMGDGSAGGEDNDGDDAETIFANLLDEARQAEELSKTTFPMNQCMYMIHRHVPSLELLSACIMEY